MSFTKEELKKIKKEGLIRLANYLSIVLSTKDTTKDIIEKILDALHPKEVQNEIEYLEGETSETPRYSVRVRRTLQSQKEKK